MDENLSFLLVDAARAFTNYLLRFFHHMLIESGLFHFE